TINKIRVVFNYAYNKEQHLIAKPIMFGEGFKRPSKKAMRKVRQEQGPRMFEANEICEMLKGTLVVGTDGPKLARASIPLRAMILLGVTAGYGNSDCGNLPMKALDLDAGWVNYPRPKTGIDRRCPLWPETITALREWLEVRPEPAAEEHQQLVFLTAKGGS